MEEGRLTVHCTLTDEEDRMVGFWRWICTFPNSFWIWWWSTPWLVGGTSKHTHTQRNKRIIDRNLDMCSLSDVKEAQCDQEVLKGTLRSHGICDGAGIAQPVGIGCAH